MMLSTLFVAALLSMPPPIPITDAVGTMGRYVPEPVGMSGNGQMAGIEPTWQAHQILLVTEGTRFTPSSVVISRVGNSLPRPDPAFANWLGKHRAIPHANVPLRSTIHAPSADSDSTPLQEDADDRSSRLDLGLGVISISAAMAARGLTSSCLASNTCHERIAFTRWLYDRGVVAGVVIGAAVNGLIHYAVARWIPKGKWRTATLGTLAAINLTNVGLDIHTVNKIERDRKR